MTQPQIPDPWQCQDCKRYYPIPSMARECERAHKGAKA